ncbi:hypothetical protein [Azospirillum sp. Sh1]|uniref:helix-turn-helix transcriptional regulator n=1 Tax=Azospirillum sp. Sh1 TaxID=2607285 RepID=UPI0011ECDD32|nr:hypothetical protein [Azospirillum sp. Sh1]KAA0576657.1 hypothetical protein FZ029_12380 [Azospirillum sp. Sh1]
MEYLTWDVPSPFVDMAVMASRLRASFAIFDDADRLIYANEGKRRLYPFFDYTVPHTFESMLRRTWEYGATQGLPVPDDIEVQLSFAQMRRRGERLEFVRRYPVNLICTHVRLPSGLNAQLRVEPTSAGLQHFFADGTPTLGLMEAIKQRNEAEQRAAALDCLAFGIAVVGPDSKIKHRNAAMDDLLDREDGLQLDEHGRLTALRQDDQQLLKRLTIMACVNELPSRTATVNIRGSTPGIFHTLSVSTGSKGSSTAVVVVAPPRLDAASVASVLRRDFGLTPAEAGMAAMIGNGLTSDDITRELGKKPSTGRDQVKAILRKLDRGQLANRGQTGLARWVAVLGAITGAARTRGEANGDH